MKNYGPLARMQTDRFLINNLSFNFTTMKKFSMLLFFAVAMMTLVSCGGTSKKEAKAEEGKECCLPIGLQLYSVRDDMA